MPNPQSITPPVIGVTADLADDRAAVGMSYVRMIERAGGLPIVLPCLLDRVDEFLELCEGIVLTGGDDPITTTWGVPMHPKAKPLDPRRQAFELALLAALDRRDRKPVLGVCLGMQLMGLHSGGTLNQHLPDSLATADVHWEKRTHAIEGELGRGIVHSHHRQALSDAGALRVVARAPDGVIEAVLREDRDASYLGVQWHPERTEDDRLGFALFEQLVNEARRQR